MKTEKIKITDIVENPNNTRIHPDRQIKEFVKSIQMFGVIRPIVVDENNMILIGHGLKKALEILGNEEVDVLRVVGLDENKKKKMLLADNKIYSLGLDDFDMIDRIIKEMQDFEIPGYDSQNLEMLYGASGLAESHAEFKQKEEDVKKRIEQQEKAKSEQEIPVSTKVQEMRKEQEEQKFVICPHCGGKVYVS